MAHGLILGMTESGKTTLARAMAAYAKRCNVGVLVLDPLRDPRWPCDFITDDQEEFLDVFWRSRSCIAFLDEGGESVGRYDTAMQKTATRGRHWGHACFYLAQKGTQLAPIVRDQCRHLFLFCSSARDGKMLAEEWNKPELEECSSFKQGEYVHAVKFGQTVRHTIGGKKDATLTDTRGRGISSARPTVEIGEGTASESDEGNASESGEGKHTDGKHTEN